MTFRELLNLRIITDSITIYKNGYVDEQDCLEVKDWKKADKVLRTFCGKILTVDKVETKLGSEILDKQVVGMFGQGPGMMGIVLEA